MSFTTAYAESVCMYAEDGRTAWFDESEVEAQKTVGWYTEPVQRLYAEGKSKVFKQSEVSAQLTVGWYTEPVQRLYAEGKNKLFKKSEVSAQLKVGWYTEPVQRLYTLDGRSKLFKKSEVSAQLKVGWYTTPQNTYKKAYAQVLRNILAYESVSNEASFSLAYIDGDNIPELIYHTAVIGHGSGAKVYTYYGGKAVKLTQSGGWDTFGEWGDILYQVKGNKFTSQWWGQGAESIEIYKIQNGKAVEQISMSGSEWQWEFYVNGIQVSYSEYLATRKRY